MRIGIVGYGNLGRSLERVAVDTEGTEVVGVFTRRDCRLVSTLGAKVIPLSSIDDFVGCIDVLCICQGSSRDLPSYAPTLAEKFNTVDTYDNHKGAQKHKIRMMSTTLSKM